MDLTSTETYTYNSSLIRKHLTSPKLKDTNASSFLHLLKILEKDEEKEGAPVEHYDFAGNLPLLLSHLFKIKSNNLEIYKELIKLLQVGLSELTKKCRELQKTINDHEKEKGPSNIDSLIVDTSGLIIDNINANVNTSFSNEKSEVTIAHDKKKNYYAIKRFKRRVEFADKQKSFLRNVSTYSQLSHYSILPFVGINLYCRTDGRFFYPSVITKYEKKKSLFDLLFKTNDKYYFSDTEKMIVLLGTATGLKYLHKHDITHGNLKPSNILINSKYEPFIGDFFSSHLDAKDPTSIAFIAPEILNYDLQKIEATKTSTLTKTAGKDLQATGKSLQTTGNTGTDNEKKKVSKYTKEADVYSFGMVTLSVLSSLAPFAVESLQPEKIIKKIISGSRPTIPSYIPSNYVKLIEKCWQNDPKDRPTIKEIVDFISESKPLPETNILEFSDYMKKVRPNHVLPQFVQIQNQKAKLQESTKAPQKTEQKEIPRSEDSSTLSERREKAKNESGSAKSDKSKSDKSKQENSKSDKSKAENSKSDKLKSGNSASAAPPQAAPLSARSRNTNTASESEMLSDLDGIRDPDEAYELAIQLKPQSIPESNRYMKRAAELGHTRGQVEYGKILLEENSDELSSAIEGNYYTQQSEKSLKTNEAWAAHYFKLAANHDDPEGNFLYGRCLYYGIGVHHNYEKAVKYLQKAAVKNNKDAQYLYALCLKEGNGTPQNIPLAVKYFKKAELNDVVSAKRHLNELGTD